MKQITKYKMTKRDFETLLYGINGIGAGVPVDHCIHLTDKGVKCHLYYGRLNEHIGTWISRGFEGCWTFDRPVVRLLNFNKINNSPLNLNDVLEREIYANHSITL
jgi:hypothetical protein